MSNVAKLKTASEGEPITGLALLRRPFEAHHISKLPKPTKQQTDTVKADFKAGHRCKVCGSWHHPDVVHLDYVGHAALTDRLLDVDPEWSWEPAALNDGLPAFDQSGGLWIKLTVCGVTRLGYGHAAAKAGQDPGAREKEVIGDALRNAAMRFGAALDLWHKGDLHAETDDGPSAALAAAIRLLEGITHKGVFAEAWGKNKDGWKAVLSTSDYVALVDVMKACAAKLNAAEPKPEPRAEDVILDDEIPF